MLDPDATQFRDVEVCSADKSVTRGEVNGKNSFGAYTGFKSFYYADGRVALISDDDAMSLMNRCFGKSAAESVEMSLVDLEKPETKASPSPKVSPSSASKAIVQEVAAEEDEDPADELAPRCWQGYCPCDTTDPDYGGADVVVCRNLRGGIPVDAQIFSGAAGLRDARRQLREFNEKKSPF